MKNKYAGFYGFILIAILISLCASCARAGKGNNPKGNNQTAAAAGMTTVPITAATEVSTPVPDTEYQAVSTPAKKEKDKQGRKGNQTNTAPSNGSNSFVPVNLNFNTILGRPTDHSITISLYSLSDAAVSAAYGTSSGVYSQNSNVVSLKAKVPQNIELTDLKPATEYFYTLNIDGKTGAEYHFMTQRAPGSTFTFTIDADPHNQDPNFNGELYANTMTNVLKDSPDFHIDLGDTFMTEKVQAKTYAEAESTFTDMRPYFGTAGTDVPLFLVNGNHEGELGWLLKSGSGSDLPVWSTQLRQLYYPNPVPNGFYTGAVSVDPALGSVRDGYYSWTWGDAQFIVLDPFWYTTTKPRKEDLNNNWDWTLGKEQYDWLKSTLENSSAKYKFVFIHNLVGGNNTDARGGIEAAPYFEWGGKNADGSDGFAAHRPGWGVPIHTMFVQNHVSAVFHGHDHVYVKQTLDGIIYQELPQPSMANYNNTSLAADYGYLSGTILGSSGHLRVTVSSEKATVEYVRSYLAKDIQNGQQNGQVDDSYSITP